MPLKLCPCGTQFETEYADRVYCTLICQRKAKATRRKSRDKRERGPEEDKRTEFFTLTNPTVAQLDTLAEGVLSGLYGEGAVVTGTIPMWEVPDNVAFYEQSPGLWGMSKKEIDVMALYRETQGEVPTVEVGRSLSPKDDKPRKNVEDIIKQLGQAPELGERVEVAAPRVEIEIED